MTTEDKQRVFNSGDFRSLSDSQRRVFRQVVEDLEARGLFRATDVSIIASYSRNVILARQASKDLDKYNPSPEKRLYLEGKADGYHQAINLLNATDESIGREL